MFYNREFIIDYQYVFTAKNLTVKSSSTNRIVTDYFYDRRMYIAYKGTGPDSSPDDLNVNLVLYGVKDDTQISIKAYMIMRKVMK